MSVDGINGRIAEFTPFMTGAYRDSLKKTPAFSIDSVLSEPATSSASHGPVASAPAAPAAPARTAASQSLAASSEFRQLFGQSSAAPATVTAAVTTPAVVTPRAAEAQQPEASFVPSFRAATGATPGYDVWSLNRTYFASPQTAQWIANKYDLHRERERISHQTQRWPPGERRHPCRVLRAQSAGEISRTCGQVDQGHARIGLGQAETCPHFERY